MATATKPKYTTEQMRSARELIEHETDPTKLMGWIATGKRLNEKTIIDAASLQLCRLPVRNSAQILRAEKYRAHWPALLRKEMPMQPRGHLVEQLF
jgi:hypothetical protein